METTKSKSPQRDLVIELKKISHNERLSEETNCFSADVYINGEKVAHAQNRGNGGSTDIHPYEGMREKLQEAELWAKSLPPHTSELGPLDSDLELVIDNLLCDHLVEKTKAKFAKRLLKDMEKGICYGTESSYELFWWKSHTIAQMLASENARAVLQKKVDELKADGKKILNTNLIGINL